MSGIYLQGVEMPKKWHTVTLTITGGGEAVVQYYDCKPQLTVPIVYKAVPVQEHGRLGDLDALLKEVNRIYDQYDAGIISEITFMNALAMAIRNAPTIIQVEEAQ